MSNIDIPNAEDAMQIAEYALGTLNAAERAACAQRLETDARLRAALQAWEQRLAPLAQFGADIAPKPDLLAQIEAALPREALPKQALRPNLKVIEGSGGADKLRKALVLWRRGAFGMAAIAASLLVALVATQIVQQTPQSYLAVVNSNGDQPPLIVRVDLASGQVFVRPALPAAASDKSLELWYIGAGTAPKSMGVVADKALDLKLPANADKSMIEKALFAVTLEPKGGSPTGNPTGPIVYKGALIKE